MPHETNQGYWNATARPAPDFPQLRGEVDVDIAIVGGGIVGVMAARLLKDSGLTVALVEALRVGRQVTGKSTAKVTIQHNIVYRPLADKFGEDRARLYAEAQTAGFDLISDLAATHKIEADFERVPAFTFTGEDARVEDLEKEVELARRLGLDYTLTRETGLPFPVAAAMRTDKQASFQPTDYLAGLAATIPGNGSHVFEHSRVTGWDVDRVDTGSGTVRARHVIMATHLPLGQVGGFYAHTTPKAEAMAAAPIPREVGGMYIGVEDPQWSIRTHRGRDGQTYAIAVGSEFQPGETQNQQQSFDALRHWLQTHFHAGEMSHRWVNEDYVPEDGAPFIGWSSGEGRGLLVATGFDGWGLTTGATAALMLRDLALGKDHPWQALFRARRLEAPEGATEAETPAAPAGEQARRDERAFDQLRPGEAGIVQIDGEDVAAWRDESGAVHAVSAACSHMGCNVGWNPVDRTWDCACHGSRFAPDGAVIHGPATAPLPRKTE